MLQHNHEPPLTRDEKQAPVALKKQWKEKRGGELDDDCSRPCRLTETPRAARAMPHEWNTAPLRMRLKLTSDHRHCWCSLLLTALNCILIHIKCFWSRISYPICLFYVLVNTDNASFMPKQNYTQALAETFCWLASFVQTKTTDTLTKNASDSLCVACQLILEFFVKTRLNSNQYDE